MATRALHEVRVGDQIRFPEMDGSYSWVGVADVRISYTSSGPESVTVTFADDREWRHYSPDMKVRTRGVK